MKRISIALLGIVIAAVFPSAHAATTIVDWTVNSAVPDDSPTGLSDTRTITGSPILGITRVDLRLQFSGGWNGDLYAYLSHSSGFVIALNRPGKTLLNAIGSGSSGLNITLSDFAASDIHTGIPGSGLVTGSWQPDARNVDPDLVLDSSPRTVFFSSFNGLSADGSWTLFTADMSSGDQSTLVSWGLTILGTPEPSRAMLLMLGSLGLMMHRRRSIA